MSEHDPTCADDVNDCRCLTNPGKWPDISTPVRLTEDERQYAYPMEQGDFYLEDDVERIVAARMSAAATRARAEGAAEALRVVRLVERDMAEQALEAWRSADARKGLTDHDALLVHADALTRWSQRVEMAMRGDDYRDDRSDAAPDAGGQP